MAELAWSASARNQSDAQDASNTSTQRVLLETYGESSTGTDLASDATVIPIEPYLPETASGGGSTDPTSTSARDLRSVFMRSYLEVTGRPELDTEVLNFMVTHELMGIGHLCRSLARDHLGEPVSTRLHLSRDRETGDQELLVRISYPVDTVDFDSVDTYLEREQSLFNAYVQAVSADRRRYVSLYCVPEDAD